MSVSLLLGLSVCLSLVFALSVCLSVFLSCSLCLTVCLPVCLSLSLLRSLCLSVSASLSVCLSVSLSLYLSAFFYLPVTSLSQRIRSRLFYLFIFFFLAATFLHRWKIPNIDDTVSYIYTSSSLNAKLLKPLLLDLNQMKQIFIIHFNF